MNVVWWTVQFMDAMEDKFRKDPIHVDDLRMLMAQFDSKAGYVRMCAVGRRLPPSLIVHVAERLAARSSPFTNHMHVPRTCH